MTYLALFLHQFEEEPEEENFPNSRLWNDKADWGFLTGKVHKSSSHSRKITGKWLFAIECVQNGNDWKIME